MKIERWLGFRVQKARRPETGFVAVGVQVYKRRPTDLAIKISLEIPDDLIEPRIEFVVAEPEELAGSIKVEVEDEPNGE